jgi:predicted ribosome quality control (RQC) complex YloA/Tae2 family protein
MIQETIRDKSYFENKYFVEGYVWDDLREALDYSVYDVRYMLETCPVSGSLYVYIHGISPNDLYRIYSEINDTNVSLGTVTEEFLKSSIKASRDWTSAFEWVRELRGYCSGIALIGDTCEKGRLYGSYMYERSEIDDVMDNLVESVDMSMGAAMYIDHLKRTSSKKIRLLKKENSELKEENKKLKQKLEAYEAENAKAKTKATGLDLLK